MSTPILGRRILQAIMGFNAREGWFTKQIPKLVELLANSYQWRNEVMTGGVVSAGGSISASVLQINMTACESRLYGRMMLLGAQTNADLFTTTGAVVKAIFADGADASAISLGTAETAYVSLILTNSNGSGGVSNADNGTPKLLAVVNGTASTYAAQTGYLTSAQIQAAMKASTQHRAATGWVHIAQILWNEGNGSPAVTITMNRNNVIADV